MLSTLKNSWKVPELRKKIIFTLVMLVIFRIGTAVPVPGINANEISKLFATGQNGLFDFLNLMSGGSLKSVSVFALSIYPYITASIIIQLLTVGIPKLEAISKEGETGRKKIAKYTKYLTIVLAIIQGLGIALGFFRSAIINKSNFSMTVIILSLVAGTSFLIWLGGQITQKGVGNGISIIIFAGIISTLPTTVINLFQLYKADGISLAKIVSFTVAALVILVLVVLIHEGQRKVPVQYAKRVVGRKMYGGQSTYIPLKVLMAGVIPVIFASSLMQFPQILAMIFTGKVSDFITTYLTVKGTTGTIIYALLNFVLTLFFTFFYTAVQFNPIEYANNLKQSGGFIPGIRPGKPTSDYLSRIISRITMLGGLTLATLASLPILTKLVFKEMSMGFGGTALLIVVGVALETIRSIETQMLSRNYKGFLK